jgi:hypothetical protein
MCLDHRSMPRKARIFLVIGCACLCAGSSLGIFDHDLGPHGPLWFDFVRGMLMGLAIAFNLGSVVIARRSAPLTS